MDRFDAERVLHGWRLQSGDPIYGIPIASQAGDESLHKSPPSCASISKSLNGSGPVRSQKNNKIRKPRLSTTTSKKQKRIMFDRHSKPVTTEPVTSDPKTKSLNPRTSPDPLRRNESLHGMLSMVTITQNERDLLLNLTVPITCGDSPQGETAELVDFNSPLDTDLASVFREADERLDQRPLAHPPGPALLPELDNTIGSSRLKNCDLDIIFSEYCGNVNAHGLVSG
ncbi:ABC multidrug transporter mdr2 [Fonsecaea monophora]|uniref:ABC multidrug transporter mdr2 n=1 Tax=Fonsecaea monophora TaxID=254056 RepID=A0A177ETV2_9EURO|nr:ABC multidrug transporter mdr2 [Fonsecaea monophora]OAG35427.1 ABC multidrug transporter mdr2 [Fonsecaea monophora]